MRVKLQAVGGNALQAELGLKQWPVHGRHYHSSLMFSYYGQCCEHKGLIIYN